METTPSTDVADPGFWSTGSRRARGAGWLGHRVAAIGRSEFRTLDRITARAWLTFVALLLGLFYLKVLGEGQPSDVRAYFLARGPDLYAGSQILAEKYLYSPAFAQAIEPLRWLGWDAFRTVWRLAELGALVALAGPWAGLLLFASPIASEINAGNVQLLLPLAVVAGFRWPAAWSFLLLTKVTPGVGLVWFAVRREWRSLAIALGATAAIVLVSVAISPGLWSDWLAFLWHQATTPFAPDWELFPVPLSWRLPVAAVLVAWGARRDLRWTVVVATYLASPVTYWAGMAILVGVIPLLAEARPRPGRPRRGSEPAQSSAT